MPCAGWPSDARREQVSDGTATGPVLPARRAAAPDETGATTLPEEHKRFVVAWLVGFPLFLSILLRFAALQICRDVCVDDSYVNNSKRLKFE